MTQQTNQQTKSSPSNRPGQMTAMMRAVMPTGPKVLRIGLVQGGKIVEERIIKTRSDVTVGPSEKSTFVVMTQGVPPNFRMFQLVGNEYHLNFLEGMTGRVALPTGISELAVLKGQAKRGPQGQFQVKLTEDSRGKVVVGETTLLFQFVAPPPVQPKPQLPMSVTRGASGMDWTTTMIAAFSFLAHFLVIGVAYSDWVDPPIEDETNIAGLVESVKALPPPPPVEEKPEEKSTEVVKDAPTEKVAAGPSRAAAPGAGGGKLNSAQAAALSNELAQLEMATLGSLAGAGPATAGVLTDGDVPTSALDAAAASGAGVGVAGTDGLKMGGGGGAIRPGMAGGGLSGIGSTGRGEGTEGSGKGQAVQGPKGNATMGGSSTSGGTVSNAARVVAGMRAGFRACYNRELQANPDAQGSIRLSIKVGPGGEVTGVTSSVNGNLGSAVACVQARAKAAQFAPPEGGRAVVTVPVTFVKQ